MLAFCFILDLYTCIFCHVRALCPQKSEEGMESLELELGIVTNYYVGAGN